MSLFRDIRDSWRVVLLKNIVFVRLLSVSLLIVGLARPQAPVREVKVHTEGIDIILAMDVSSSMLAQDIEPGSRLDNRLNLSKDVIRKFIQQRKGDRIGIIVFAARAYMLSPLTLDHAWLLNNLARAEAEMIDDGTAIGEGLLAALNRIKGSNNKGRIIILLTDGRNNAGEISPMVAAEAARALGVKVYTIGVGSRGKAVFPVIDPFGATVYRQVPAEVDESTLRSVAARTGAAYFRADDAAGLRRIYENINRLEKRPVEEKIYSTYRELFHFFVLPALLLLLLESFLNSTLLRRLP